MQINYKSWLPHILAIALFAIIAIIYFLPAFEGKALLQPDITNYLGEAKEVMDFRAHFHTEPLWTNSMFGGMPAYQVSITYPANLIQYIFIALVFWLPFPAGIVFMYCLGFYILLKVLKVDSWVAIIGSLAFGFSSFFFIILSVGHNSEADAISFMAPTFAGVILAFSGKRLWGAALTGLSLALELYSGHLQITYYLLLMLCVYGIIQFIIAFKSKQIPGFFKTIGILAVAAILAVSTDITSLWLTIKYEKYSTRGKSDLTFNPDNNNRPANKSSGLSIDYATQWSYGVPETMTLMIPNFMGGASEPIGANSASAVKGVDPQYQQAVSNYEQYWGNQPGTSGPVYAGAIICFFALLGFFIIKGPMKWFIFFATILSIMLSWGKNFMWFYSLFFYHLPGFNKFRAVSMILVIAELTLPLLAALTIDRLIKDTSFFNKKIPLRFFKKSFTGKKIFIAALILTAGVSLLCFIMPGTFSDFQKDNEVEQMVQEYSGQGTPEQLRNYFTQIMPSVVQARKKVFTSDAMRSAIFILLAAALIWVYYKKLADKKIILAVLLFFIIMDMYNVDKRYLNDKSGQWTTKKAAKEPFQPDEADLQIDQDTTPDYRVYNTTIRPDQDSRTSYFHKSLGGYSGVKMKRYDEILPYINEHNMSVIDMLNAKYFIIGGKDGKNHAEINPGALGNAWFVDNYKLVPNADSEYTSLANFNPAQTAIVNQPKFGSYFANVHFTKDTTASIKMLSYEPNHLVYKTDAHSEQLAVFSEIYYKDGWDAFIDDKPADYIQVNYILRAMLIPAGNHTIVFKFEPKDYSVGEKISLAGSLALLLGCLVIFLGPLWKPKEIK